MRENRYKISRRFLIFWTLFIGIGAVFGAIVMLCDPVGNTTGMAGLLPGMQVLPFADILFSNLVFPGIALLCVNGIPNIVASILLFQNRKSGVICGTIFGVTLMLWIIIQFIIYPFNVMSTLYFIFGFLQFVTGFICFAGFEQQKFVFEPDNYKNIGTSEGAQLVVYFSRTGYTRKIAYEIANEQGADLLEIKTTEKIDGNLGFWWCGRFGMHHWSMPLQSFYLETLSKYSSITICSPVWVFGISAPIRGFCEYAKGKIKSVNYVFTHFMNARFSSLAKEMDELLGVKHTSFRSLRCRYGKFKEVK